MTQQSAKGRGALPRETSCPLPNAHNRLRHAHEHWHQVLTAYAEPEAFCFVLNAALAAFRSVTFVLQKEKRTIPGFDGWYTDWQAQMRADPVLRWLATARNHVLKEGDLATHSTARVSIAVDWAEAPVTEFRVSPLASPEEIAQSVDLSDLPDHLRRAGVLMVDRRWVADDLPEHELVEALAHCYGVYATILCEAHERCGVRMQTFGGEDHKGVHHRSEHIGGRLPCMVMGRDSRTAQLHLGRGEFVWLDRTSRRVTRDEMEGEAQFVAAARRYGMTDGPPLVDAGKDILEDARFWHEQAQQILTVDKKHDSMSVLFRGDLPLEIHRAEPEDQQTKLVIMQDLANQVEALGVTGLIRTAEVWEARMLPADHPDAELRAGERADRGEALVTIAATSDGRTRVYSTRFSRVDGEIVLEPTTSENGPFAPSSSPCGVCGAAARPPEKPES
jgi:hypothetical protein